MSCARFLNGRVTPFCLILALLLVSGCPRSSTDDEDLGEIDGVETSKSGITDFVLSDDYQGWLAEPEPHVSAGLHPGQVRTFFNELLVASLEEENDEHPVGSMVVKELFESDGETLRGHAFMVKFEEGSGAKTWLFYEGFSNDDYGNPYYGIDHPTCTGCHAEGRDFIISGLPSTMTAD